MGNKNAKQIIPISWIGWTVGAFITGFFAGFFNVTLAETYGHSRIFALVIVVFLCILSAFLGLLAVKELLADAHVRALEVYYGKSRMIANEDPKQDNNKAGPHWLQRGIKNLADYD